MTDTAICMTIPLSDISEVALIEAKGEENPCVEITTKQNADGNYSMIMVFDTTRHLFCIRYARSANSRGCRLISMDPRNTFRRIVFNVRSPTLKLVGSSND